jgi:hypothetical protein
LPVPFTKLYLYGWGMLLICIILYLFKFKIRVTENSSFLVVMLCRNSSPVTIQHIFKIKMYLITTYPHSCNIIIINMQWCLQIQSGFCVQHTLLYVFFIRKRNLLYVLQILHSVTVNIHEVNDWNLILVKNFL